MADIGNHRIRTVSPSGEVRTLAGTGQSGDADGPAGRATFAELVTIAVDRAGAYYIADIGNNSVRKIVPTRD